MPKLLPNLNSRTLTEAEMKTIFDAANTIDTQLGTPTPITQEAYDALAKLGDVLKIEYDAVFNVTREHPKYLDEEQTIDEIEKDKLACEQYDLIVAHLQKLLAKVVRERGIRGAEYRNACSIYEENVVNSVKKGRLEAQMIKDRLDKIPRSRTSNQRSNKPGSKEGGKGGQPASE